MKYIFELQRPSSNKFRGKNIKVVQCDFQSKRYYGPNVKKLVPNNIKCCNSLSEFKKLIIRENQSPALSDFVKHTLSK